LESDAILDILPNNAKIDRTRIGIVGFSAGGWLARMSTVYFLKQVDAKGSTLIPRVCCLFFGMAGDLTLDYWVKPRPLRAKRPEHLVRGIAQIECSDSPYTEAFMGQDTATRAAWCDYWWDSAQYLDLCIEQTGFSRKLSQTAPEHREKTLDSSLEDIFTQVFLARSPLATTWPITLLVHGTSDNIVLLEESQHTYQQMQSIGIPVTLRTVEKGNHDLVDAKTGEHLPDKVEALLEAALFMICHLRR
jgi:acetyl esterase/lipase